MSNNSAVDHIAGPPSKSKQQLHSRRQHCQLRSGSLKRDSSSFLRPVPEYSYPSPPMSNPPSPRRHPPGNPFQFTVDSQRPSNVAAPPSTHMPALAVSPPSTQHGLTYARGDSFSDFPSLASSSLQSGARRSGQVTFSSHQQGVVPPSIALSSDGTSSTHGAALKSSRKSKAHVASACINCKRAHLSCDVGRPCARCVATGKQDSCRDVPHKKRGRPRLREEGDLKFGQIIPKAGPSSAAPVPQGGFSSRPMTVTKSRRSDSFRSIRSNKSEGSLGGISISPTYSFLAGPPTPQASFSIQQQPSNFSDGTLYDFPIAYLDLDLTFIKANPSFRHTVFGGQEIAGRQISDLFDPADGENFEHIRLRLRDERERREPTYMPPIVQPGQSPIQNVTDADIERYVQHSDERTYTWVQKQGPFAGQSFTARVQLAKADTYFVVVVLQIARPVIDQQQSGRPINQPLLVRTPTYQPQGPPQEDVIFARPTVRRSASSGGYIPLEVAAPTYVPALQRRSVGQPPIDSSSRMFTPPPQYRQQQYQPRQTSQSFPAYRSALPPVLGPPSPPTQVAGSSARLPVPEPSIDPLRRVSFPSIHDRRSSVPDASFRLPPLVRAPPPRLSPIITRQPPPLQQPEISTPGSAAREPLSASSDRNDNSSENAETSSEPARKRRRMGIDDVLHRD